MYASQSGHEESVRALIEKGASLEDWAPLQLAAYAATAYRGNDPRLGHSEVVGVLIGAGMAAGLDVDACLGGRTVLMHVCQCGHVESVRALIEKGASLVAVDEVRIPT